MHLENNTRTGISALKTRRACHQASSSKGYSICDLFEGRNTRDMVTKDQQVDIMRTLVGKH